MKEDFITPKANNYRNILGKIDLKENAEVKCGACSSCSSSCGGTTSCK